MIFILKLLALGPFHGKGPTRATDSICPKGWEIARHNRNKSQHNLLIEIYGKNITGTIKNANEADSGIKSIPFSLLHTGYYYHANGTRGGRELYGSYRESYAISETDAYYLSFYSTYFHPQNTYSKGYGFSLRCVAKFMLY